MNTIRSIAFLLTLTTTTSVFAREWSDKTGQYQVNADLIGYSDTTVVLKRKPDDLVAVPIEQLSDSDRKYLETQTKDTIAGGGSGIQVWELKSGLKLPGRIIGFDKHGVTIQRRLGKVYVNNQRFDKMPGVYRAIIPKLVEQFTSEEIDGEKGLEDWAREQRGKPRTFECAGVMIELEDSNLYCVPFFLFTDEVFTMLKPGWERWLAAKEDYDEKEKESFLLQAQSRAYEQQQMRARQIQQLQLNLQAYDAGLFDLWEVTMYPQAGGYGIPLSVVVPATDSQQAAAVAHQQNPSYVVGPMRIVRRRN
ncbi:SHD1 domain-containing protein [Stieleria magnilauensis]|uniref:SLA1 homology domain-containing protein n=1 Tax=Stieleria magnilauensis TaxID=2527963 RepID=A0ABX5XNZ5_9BACT|nr:hypothetical protein TBK1r_26750 [Planctomycetes bacterium TBK1r]